MPAKSPELEGFAGRLDPEDASGIEVNAVGGIEHVRCCDVRRPGKGVRTNGRIPRQHEQVPSELERHHDRRPSGAIGRPGRMSFSLDGWGPPTGVSSPPLLGFLPRFLLFVSAQ